MENKICTDTPVNVYCRKHVVWSAIVGGALIAIGLSFLFNLFCVGIGLSLVSMTDQGQPTMMIGGFIALLICSFVGMFVAGSTAGYLAKDHCANKKIGAFYGFTAWCLALVVSMVLAFHAGNLLPDYRHFVSVKTPAVQIQSTNVQAGAEINVNMDEQSVQHLGYVSFLIFILFFVGALAATWGGCFGLCCGTHCGNKEHPHHSDHPAL